MQSPQPSRHHLYCLQAGRGVAALLVVLYHATVLLGDSSYGSHVILYGLFNFGSAGVEFFFALSGFVMVTAHRTDIGLAKRLPRYVRKRVTRIYPIYWFITAGCASIYLILGDNRTYPISQSIFLFGHNTNAVLGVAWTLFHEVVFYFFFSLMVLNARVGTGIIIIWFLLCAVMIYFTPPHYSLSSINLIFGMGMIAAYYESKMPSPSLLTLLSIIAFFCLGIEAVYYELLSANVRSLGFGLISAIGLASAVRAERQGHLVVPRWLIVLGDASYSMYLVHYPVIALSAKILLVGPTKGFPAIVLFAALIAAAVVAGLITHWLIERPLLNVFARTPAPSIAS